MKISNLIRIAWRALLLNKKRAFLTMLGIIIGISSVVLMVSLGQSSSLIMSDQFSGLGTDLILVSNVRRDVMGVTVGTENMRNLKLRDVEAIRSRARYISRVTPCVTAMDQLVCGSRNYPGVMMGANVEYLSISNSAIDRGRAFTEREELSGAKVCLLGQTVIKSLFPDGVDPVGKEVRFGKIPLTVIGTLVGKGKNMTGDDYDDTVICPYTTVQRRVLNIDYIHMIMASAVSESVSALAVDELELIMRESHRLPLGVSADFEVTSLTQILSMASMIMTVMSIFLVSIAAISLIVGGIGIMNIMYVTVTERTREIGLRRSLGARRLDIMRQFLIESAILSITGGIIGILIGLLLSSSVLYLLGLGFTLNYPSIVISFIVCVTIGLFFGWYPSKSASSLDPITALRYE